MQFDGGFRDGNTVVDIQEVSVVNEDWKIRILVKDKLTGKTISAVEILPYAYCEAADIIVEERLPWDNSLEVTHATYGTKEHENDAYFNAHVKGNA